MALQKDLSSRDPVGARVLSSLQLRFTQDRFPGTGHGIALRLVPCKRMLLSALWLIVVALCLLTVLTWLARLSDKEAVTCGSYQQSFSLSSL
jgi:hypothetical protein